MSRLVVLAAALALAGTARAGETEPHFGPPGPWVKPAPLPSDAGSDASNAAPAKALLLDVETNYSPEGDRTYVEFAGKVLTPDGLSALGSMTAEWNPDIESLTIHKLNIVRDGKVIDRLPIDKFVTLRRETNLEKAMLDGRLTAAVQITDLQVGDVLDFAYTVTRNDPIVQGRSEGEQSLVHGFESSTLRFRDVWPASKPVRWRSSGQLSGVKPTATPDGGTEVAVELHGAVAKAAPDGAPARFKEAGVIEFSQFSDWTEVSSLFAPLYAKAAVLSPTSPLKAEAAKIRAASSDPEVRASLALRLVQDQVRYLFVGLDNGGYNPATADVTWSRRFGDCKGKTVLLLALLNELGVSAEPVLVHASLGDGIDQHLPRPGVFNHVIVRAFIDGRAFWLDGTRVADRDIRTLSEPAFGWGLPLRTAGAKLERMAGEPLLLPDGETVMAIDASKGLDQPPSIKVQTILHGPAAVLFSRKVGSVTHEEAERGLTDAWAKTYGWIDVQGIDWTYDASAGEFRASMHGVGKQGGWNLDNSTGAKAFEIDGSAFAKPKQLARAVNQDQETPFAVEFPTFERSVTTVKLPDGGEGYSLVGENLDETILGIDYRRFARFEHGMAVMTRSTRSVKTEVGALEAKLGDAKAANFRPGSDFIRSPIPAARASKEPDALVARGYDLLNQDRPDAAIALFAEALAAKADYLPALVGRGDALAEKGDFEAAVREYDRAAALSADPAVAAGRAGVLFAAGRYDQAVKVYTDAIARAPLPGLYRGRAQAWAAAGKVEKALEDAEAAIRLAPREPAGYVLRGELKLGRHEPGQALEDFDLAVRLDPDDADNLVGRGLAYAALKQYERAAAEFDEAHRADPAALRPLQALADAEVHAARYDQAVNALDQALDITPGAPALLNARCWARGGWGQQLDQALADCEAALKTDPKSPAYLDSRGLVRLRLGKLDDAIADFNAALSAEPKLAPSLYGRGLARLKKGDARGRSDLAAARAIAPDVESQFERFGLKP